MLSEEDVVLFKQEKGDELTVIVETKAKPVEMSKLELLEKEMIEEFGTDENDLEWTILDDIDAEILKKRTISKCVDLYENDEEDLDYADFSSVKDGDMLYFKSVRRQLKRLNELRKEIEGISISKFYGERYSVDDSKVKDGYMD